jgi:phosphopantetheinyl transferase (holo-ACP synthase)
LLVGNDVVDLRDPENQPHAIHARFDERVFNHAERARLAVEATAHLTRWRMWAAKESAYKVASKLDQRVRFLPRRFSVQFTGHAQAVVRHAVGRFDITFSGTEDWIHAVATSCHGASSRFRPSALIERSRRSGLAALDASLRVRALASSALEHALSIAPGQVEIARVGRVPVALWKTAPLPVDMSLSHHGRFLACVWSPTK